MKVVEARLDNLLASYQELADLDPEKGLRGLEILAERLGWMVESRKIASLHHQEALN